MEEPHIWTIDFAGIPEIIALFDQYKFSWMGEPSKRYSLELVLKFYASYVTSIDLITPQG